MENKIKYPKKGAAKRVSESFAKLLKRPLPKKLFDIVDADYERRKKEKSNDKKVAKPHQAKDVEI